MITTEQILALFQANADDLAAINTRLDKIDARVNHLVVQLDNHFEIEWATKRELEALRVEIWRVRQSLARTED
ncbi:hypothetical protein [Methylobacterium sp. ap11]|uniref:hypothetical protein n=1 Tax=Methylobacterium sp. ap11 TaxID=1761799 RepID=UPI001160AC5E|nr:hypothetical protein [Methylobacterium sp. ap11]